MNLRKKSRETRVTISCDKDLPIEQRVEILTFLMAESLQGSTLKWIERWDICIGEIEFIKISREGVHVPRGEATITLSNVNGDGSVVRIHERLEGGESSA